MTSPLAQSILRASRHQRARTLAILGKEYYRLPELAELWSTADRVVTVEDLVHFAAHGRLTCVYRLNYPLVWQDLCLSPKSQKVPFRSLGLDEEEALYERFEITGFVQPTLEVFKEIELKGSAFLTDAVNLRRLMPEGKGWEPGRAMPLIKPDELFVLTADAEVFAQELGLPSLLPKKATKATSNPGSNRRSTVHKESCRAIAAWMWRKDPERTIQDVIESDEIALTCSPHTYGKDVLRKWVNDLCPNPTPGRPRKKNPQDSA